jgi:glyoxylase-like metal-dependent hydrolase (beta-lactamase superfamily II)
MGRAHTTNDVIVYLKNRKLLVTGDIVFLGRHPVLFDKGCNVATWIGVLDSLSNRSDIASLVPGHGPVSNKSALQTIRDYFVLISDAIDNASKLAELKAKYKGYASIPGMASFDKTVSFIRAQRKEQAPSGKSRI